MAFHHTPIPLERDVAVTKVEGRAGESSARCDTLAGVMRFAGLLTLIVLSLSCGRTIAHADASAPADASPPADTSPPTDQNHPSQNPPLPQDQSGPKDKPDDKPAESSDAPVKPKTAPTAEDICRAVEEDAAKSELPVEFFARVIWQESRFNARVVSPKGALGIAQFMPLTAEFRGLADPLDPIEALEHSASYLHDLRAQFGNLGLAAAAYNAGPGRVSAWLANKRPLPSETRNYVVIVTGSPADEWASVSPPKNSQTTIPAGIPCTRLANLILARAPPKPEQQRIAIEVPRWGMQLTAGFNESQAWALYHPIEKRYAGFFDGRQPIVVARRNVNFNNLMRYNIRISDNDRAYLEQLCTRLTKAGGACVVLRNN
jgi:hypothetical protein